MAPCGAYLRGIESELQYNGRRVWECCAEPTYEGLKA